MYLRFAARDCANGRIDYGVVHREQFAEWWNFIKKHELNNIMWVIVEDLNNKEFYFFNKNKWSKMNVISGQQLMYKTKTEYDTSLAFG